MLYNYLLLSAPVIWLPSSTVRGLRLLGFTTKALNAGKRFPFFVPLVDTAAGNLMPLSPALNVETWEATIALLLL